MRHIRTLLSGAGMVGQLQPGRRPAGLAVAFTVSGQVSHSAGHARRKRCCRRFRQLQVHTQLRPARSYTCPLSRDIARGKGLRRRRDAAANHALARWVKVATDGQRRTALDKRSDPIRAAGVNQLTSMLIIAVLVHHVRIGRSPTHRNRLRSVQHRPRRPLLVGPMRANGRGCHVRPRLGDRPAPEATPAAAK
jgi:hypothetical protein